MRKILANIILWVTLPVFVLFAVGVGVFEHMCATRGTISWSHAPISECCGVSNVCSIELVAESCCSSNTLPESETALQAESCCSFDSFMLALDESFTTEKPRINVPLFTTAFLAETAFVTMAASALQSGPLYKSHAPPGELSGLDFLISIQQLKIAC